MLLLKKTNNEWKSGGIYKTSDGVPVPFLTSKLVLFLELFGERGDLIALVLFPMTCSPHLITWKNWRPKTKIDNNFISKSAFELELEVQLPEFDSQLIFLYSIFKKLCNHKTGGCLNTFAFFQLI